MHISAQCAEQCLYHEHAGVMGSQHECGHQISKPPPNVLNFWSWVVSTGWQSKIWILSMKIQLKSHLVWVCALKANMICPASVCPELQPACSHFFPFQSVSS